MSVDLGKARTGIAVCDKCELLASPVTVIYQKDNDALAAEICSLAAQYKAELLVVGLPVNMDGSEGESAKNARAFALKLQAASGVGVELSDERCTTLEAHKILNVTNTRGKKRKAVVDAVSAVIILEDYLHRRKNLLSRESAEQ